ncbi:RHS repeat-associated core domain-containing protein [Spirillospora albida]|uniref:RHS repeat-associated core domain-containing protein n=1 Tax=Spirillospora albida TaxID=58123 RepID=UPI0004C29A80|nr:RHS repeat-associated core domain-containing protein [Spirillospora albida]
MKQPQTELSGIFGADHGKGNTSFVYTADGDRLIRRDPTGTTLYLPGTEVKLAKGATTPTGTRYYTHTGETIATRTTTGVTYLPADHQGTTQATIDAADPTKTARRRYTPFGQPRGTNGTWPTPLDKGFVGGTNDTTALTHLGAREYNPNTGRFTAVDPIFDPADPQSWNGYAYSANSPITKSDPSGLMACATPAECKNTTPRVTDDTPRNNWVENNHPGHTTHGQQLAAKQLAPKPPVQKSTPKPPPTFADIPNLHVAGDLILAPSWDALNAAMQDACEMGPAECDNQIGHGNEDLEYQVHEGICTKHPDWCGGAEPRILTANMGAIFRVLARGLPAGLRAGANARKNYHVYQGFKGSDDVYVGITNSLTRRQAQHGERFILRAMTEKPVTRGEARAIEQAMINRNPQYLNKINSISPKRGEYYRRAVEWGEAWLRVRGF